DGGAGDGLRPGDGRGDAVGHAGRDREAGVEVEGRAERQPGQEGVDVGDRTRRAPHAGARHVGRGDRTRGRRVEAAGGGVREGQGGRDVGAVDVAHDDVDE